MEKLRFKGRTLDDEIAKDALTATAILEKNSKTANTCFTVGGFATQSYLAREDRRETADLDFAVLLPMDYDDFRNYSAPIRENLFNKGYQCELKKSSNNYKIFMQKDSREGTFTIEFARRNEQNMAKHISRLKEEFANTRKKMIEGTDVTYRVSSPEDIAVPKLVRSLSSLKRNPKLSNYFCFLEGELDAKKKQDLKDTIADLREDASIDLGDATLSEELRFASDLYDVRLLSQTAGFNVPYLEKSASRWDNLVPKSAVETYFLSLVLPNLS